MTNPLILDEQFDNCFIDMSKDLNDKEISMDKLQNELIKS